MLIFKIKIGREKRKEILRKIKLILDKKKSAGFFIATLNAEILLKAKKNKTYRNVLNRADVRIIDGFSIVLLAFLKRRKIGERMTGADLAEIILREVLKRKLKIGFVLKKNGFSNQEDLKKFIKQQQFQPELFEIIEAKTLKDAEKIKQVIQQKRIEVLLVGLGAPEQELLIEKIKQVKTNLKLAIGVGGTFDFWTGRKKRAPSWMRKIGMEWFWRLLIQPNRFKRIWQATIKFLVVGMRE